MKYYLILVSWMTILLSVKNVDAYSLTSNLEEEICPGQDVVLTCSNYYENVHWFYDGISLGYQGSINTTKAVTVSGFTFSLSSLLPDYTSTLSFRADADMNGHRVLCQYNVNVYYYPYYYAQELTHVLIFEEFPSPPTDVRLTNIMSNSGSASVTIEWDPPSEGRGPFNYTIMAITDLLSGPLPVTTSMNYTTITINYNTDYAITVTASNCAGDGFPSDELQFSSGLSSSLVSTTESATLVVMLFIIGVLGGFTGGALAVYGCYKWRLSHQSKHDLPSSSPQPPPPLYEVVEMKTEVNVMKTEVNENVAYGRVN